MKTFTIHHPSDTPAGVLGDPDKAVFLKEGAAWIALFVPFLWALFNRLWVVAALILAVTLVFGSVAQWLNLPPIAALAISALINLLIALEGNELRRWTLERNGYVLVGVVSAQNQSDCEQMFFDRLVQADQTRRQKPAPIAPTFRLAASQSEDGLFPVSGDSR